MRPLPSPLPTATLAAILAVALPGCLAPDTAEVRAPDSTGTTIGSTAPPPSDTLAWRTETVELAGSECDAREGWGCSTVDLARPVFAATVPAGHTHQAIARLADDWTRAEIAAELGGERGRDTELDAVAQAFLDDVDRDLRESPRRPPSYVDLVIRVVRNDGRVLALELRGSTYGGGAHPVPHVRQMNAPFADPDIARLSDLLVEGGLHAILTHAEADLGTRWEQSPGEPLSEGWLFVDELPEPEHFLATPDGLKLTYNVYEIAPYVVGPIEILVPWSVAEPWLVDPGTWVP